MVSKSLSTSERFASLQTHAGPLCEFCQALFPLLVAHADDHGRQSGDEFTVKHLVHPTSRRSLDEFGLALFALHKSKLIVWYQVSDRKYIQINQFDPHQVGLHKRTDSKIPTSDSGKFPEIPGNSGGFPLKRTEEKGTELKGRELKGNELQRGSLSQQASNANNGLNHLSSADADFEAFRTAYPASRRVGGKTAKTAFARALKATKLSTILTQLAQHQRSEQWQTPKLIPLMTTWLNQERWNQTLPEPTGIGQSTKTAGNLSALKRFAERQR